MDTQETKIYLAALIAAAVLGIILIYFIISMIRQQQRTRKLHLEKIQAEISAQENERKRIASDLHDDIGPLLSAIKFKINSVDLVHTGDKKIIDDASNHIDSTLDTIRKISFDLMPNTLMRKGLPEAIEEFISKLEKLVNLKIQFEHHDLQPLPDEVKINLYRIILEIINNTVKHSQAKNLKIELSGQNKKILLYSSDDGVGFDYDMSFGTRDGLGLKNLISRAEVMGAELIVDTKPGKGVTYNIFIPLS